MIVDFRESGAPQVPVGTVVVVGSGPAGLAAAHGAVDGGRRVLLVESGGLEAADEGTLNAGVVEGHAYAGLVEGRTRAFGGTAWLWHGQCMRLHPHDVAHRPWVAGSGWPLDLHDLGRHYAAAERLLDVSGRGYDVRRWEEHDHLPPVPWDDEHLLHDFTEYARDPSMQATRSRLGRHPLVTVLLHATAAAVRVRDGAVVGVELRSLTGRREVVPATTVVLATGAIENARLLQLSDPEGVGLGTGRAHTGRYLQDHPIVRTARVSAFDHRVLQDRYVLLRGQGRRLFPKVRLSPHAQEAHGLLDATAVFVHDPSPAGAAARRLLVAARERSRGDVRRADLLATARGAGPLALDVLRRVVLGRGSVAPPEAVWLQVWVEQSAEAWRRVDLATGAADRDALGLARARVRWGVTDQEIDTVRRLTRWVGHDLVRLGIGSLAQLPAMIDDDAFRAAAGDAAHPSGTTRMSVHPQDGVVGPDLEVHGVRGLDVVGGSVFPVAGYANPTLTIVALAHRLGERLAAPQAESSARARSTSASSTPAAASSSATAPEAQA